MHFHNLSSGTRRVRPLLALVLALSSVAQLPISSAFAAPTLPAPIAQLATSKGATLYSSPQLGVRVGDFLTAFGAEQKLPVAGDTKAQIWTWSDDAYKSGRMAFWRAALQKSLSAAGYEVKDFDRHSIATNIYASEYGFSEMDEDSPKRPFAMSGSEDQWFFTAIHSQSGQVLAGMWIDSPNSKTVLLAVAPLGTRTVAKKAPLPGVSGSALLVKDPSDVMKGASQPRTPTFSALSPRRGYATGQVKDPAGRPIVGATISVESSALGGTYTTVSGKTNAQGIYAVVLPAGACRVATAYHSVSYNNQSFYLPLRAVDGERDTFNSKNGHVENFVLQLWGVADPDRAAADPKDGAAYYGAPIRIQYFTQDITEGSTLQITLKPQGALVGGVPGRILVVRVPVSHASSLEDLFINDVPIGRYQMTGQILDEGESLPLKIHRTYDKTPPAEIMMVDFKNNSSQYASPNRSGIARFDVVMEP